MTPPTRMKVSAMLQTGAAFVIVVAGMKAASSIIVLFLLAGFIAIITTPLFIGLQRKGIPSWLALLILILNLVIISTVGAYVIGNSLVAFTSDLGDYQAGLQGYAQRLGAWLVTKGVLDEPDHLLRDYLNMGSVMGIVANTATALMNILKSVLIILLVVIFMLLEAALLPKKVRAMPGLTKSTWSGLQEVVDNVRQYMGMKTVMSLLTGVLVGVLTAVLGVDYPILLGVLAFLLNYVPNIGSIMAAIPGILLALIEFGYGKTIGVAAGYVVINVLVSNIIEPRFMGKGLGLSPMIIVVSLIFWGWVLGPIGMLLSVPLTMTVKIVLQSIDSTRGIGLLMGSAVPNETDLVGEDVMD